MLLTAGRGVFHRVVRLVLAAWLAMSAGALAQPTADPQIVLEDASPLQVEIGGRSYALDALVVRRPGADRLPVALITHGASPGNPRAADISWLRGWAHDLAQRGWLAVAVMRRGYGRSDGEVADDAGTCTSPDVGRYLDAHADDLQAALQAVARRPDADMTRVIAIGDSAGGAAVMALAARTPSPVVAAINISGGLGRRAGPFHPDPACDAYTSDLVWNFARFGATAHVPTLWLYAENDSWFRPGLVSRMRAAFTGSGGEAHLVMLPPFGADGHALFFAPGGREVLLPEVDDFLRKNGLPTWDEAAFAGLMARLSPSDRLTAEYYLRALPTEKALAMGPSGGLYWHKGRWNLDDARTAVLAYCRKQSGADCQIVAENFRPLALPAAKDVTAR